MVVPSFSNVDVDARQKRDDVIIGLKEKTFCPVLAQKRMRSNIFMVGVGGPNEENNVCQLGRLNKLMFPESVTAHGLRKPTEIGSAIAGDILVGGCEHVNRGHSIFLVPTGLDLPMKSAYAAVALR
jgi:hypothetical protein